MAIKDKDFIEIEYTGKLKDDDIIFDTTDEELAKAQGLEQEGVEYGPVIVCVGEGHLLQGLDKNILGKEPGKYSFNLTAEEGFGKRDAKLIQLVNTNKFKKEGINPVPNLQVNIDGMIGMIKTVSGGRTIVDFNNPLAGKDLTYDIDIKKIVKDPAKQIKSLVKLMLGIHELEVSVKESKAEITTKTKVPKEIQPTIIDKIKELVEEVKDIEIKNTEDKQKDNKTAKTEENPQTKAD